jgi:hypothetical protein
MYTDEEVFKIIVEAKQRIGPFKTTKEFIKKYHGLRASPSIVTLTQRFGGIKRLLARVEDWEAKRHSVGIMNAGEYITQSGDAVMRIKPSYSFFEVEVRADGKTHRWKIPRHEL